MAEPSQADKLFEEGKKRILDFLFLEYQNSWTVGRENERVLSNLLAAAAALGSAAIIGSFYAWQLTEIGAVLVFNIALPLIFLVIILLATLPLHNMLRLADYRLVLEYKIKCLLGEALQQYLIPPIDAFKYKETSFWGLETWTHTTENDQKYAKSQHLRNWGLYLGIGLAYFLSILVGEIRLFTAGEIVGPRFHWVFWLLTFAPAVTVLFTVLCLISVMKVFKEQSYLH